MQAVSLKRSVLTILPAFAAFLVMQACGGGDDAVAQEAADPMEGVWESVVTIRDCTTSAVLTTFNGAQMFHRGGTMADTNASPTATRGPGFGTWAKSGANYVVKFRFYVYDSTGAVSGVMRAQRTVTLGATAGTATSVNTNQLFDLTGAVVRNGCGTDVSTRVL